MRENTDFYNQGFSAIELLLLLVVVAVLGFSFYLIKSQPAEEILPTPNLLVSPIEESNAQITTLPTTSPLPADSTDTDVNAVAEELNQLEQEIGTLDQLDTDLSFPTVDFSD